ncbi:MAG: hypothetical protein HF975_04545 [ANME-2 cluster archaeon]|nr:hypothetical protein [ANME-2 cluster archaeon]
MIEKDIRPEKKPYMVLNKEAVKSTIKDKLTDAGGTFYIFDMYDTSGNRVALNRYVYELSTERPFIKPTKAEDDIIHPPKTSGEDEVLNGK